MLRLLTNSYRKRAAAVCLLVLAFFYAQAATLACAVATGVCCEGDHCPIAAHHHPRPAAKDSTADCGHDMSAMEHGNSEDQHNAGRIDACSMSCCQTHSEIAFHAPTYLVPPAFVAEPGMREMPLLLTPNLKVVLFAATPPVPPPKHTAQTA